jgi:hypothetical protein
MNLSYEQRIELLDIVKEEYSKQWKTILEIDAKFKCNDTSMRNDKENYWIKKQAEAYDRKQLLDGIKTELTLSL